MGSDEAVSSAPAPEKGRLLRRAQHRPRARGLPAHRGRRGPAVQPSSSPISTPTCRSSTPPQTPDQYYQQHPLTILGRRGRGCSPLRPGAYLSHTSFRVPLTRLLWNTVGDVPQSYFAVKSLCLLCTWPLPTSTSTSDPTHILCGVMMKTATGIGLHRPNHINDFSRCRRRAEQGRVARPRQDVGGLQHCGAGDRDRLRTARLDALRLDAGGSARRLWAAYALAPELEARLQIERFCDKVSKEMYSNASDPQRRGWRRAPRHADAGLSPRVWRAASRHPVTEPVAGHQLST